MSYVCALLLIVVPAFIYAFEWHHTGSISTVASLSDSEIRAEANEGSSFRTRPISVEAAYKFSISAGERFSASIKTCTACHGLEIDQAYGTMNLSEAVSLDAGRINVPFGAFNESHDPANNKTISKPLPYAMGDMLAQDDFNLGVIPMPLVDNGVGLNGTFWPSDALSVYFAGYVTNGFKTIVGDEIAWNRNWTASQNVWAGNRDLLPSPGARAGLTFSNYSIGSSFLYGSVDRNSEKSYRVIGADFQAQFVSVSLKMEYLYRRTSLSDQVLEKPKYEKIDPYFVKSGGYLLLAYRPTSVIECLYNLDFLLREGNLIESSALTNRSGIFRNLVGFNLSAGTSILLKTNLEFWKFTDFEDELVARSALVFTF